MIQFETGRERGGGGAKSENRTRDAAHVGTCPARVGTYQRSPFEDNWPRWHGWRQGVYASPCLSLSAHEYIHNECDGDEGPSSKPDV